MTIKGCPTSCPLILLPKLWANELLGADEYKYDSIFFILLIFSYYERIINIFPFEWYNRRTSNVSFRNLSKEF